MQPFYHGKSFYSTPPSITDSAPLRQVAFKGMEAFEADHNDIMERCRPHARAGGCGNCT